MELHRNRKLNLCKEAVPISLYVVGSHILKQPVKA
nr:unnamed protein product [Callosobruchus analis]